MPAGEQSPPELGGAATDLSVASGSGAHRVTAVELTGCSFQVANQAMDPLVEAGVLVQVSIGRRNRTFEAPELIDLFTALERRLASPSGDTLVADPVRRVPKRRL